ncbi:anthranilate synthase [Anopheles sinensis]|uniref:Anthranilate synthase n=1 Tax=Anopheles sinensis TaxID=74873 RepID=A0A084VXH2_ANOSI|nr:anthranilate synthase [Anopheles sinensis]
MAHTRPPPAPQRSRVRKLFGVWEQPPGSKRRTRASTRDGSVTVHIWWIWFWGERRGWDIDRMDAGRYELHTPNTPTTDTDTPSQTLH